VSEGPDYISPPIDGWDITLPLTYRERTVTPKGREGHKTHKHWWCPCDVCGQWLLTSSKERPCKITPRCKGKHRRVVT
jgi:hypothetical protein